MQTTSKGKLRAVKVVVPDDTSPVWVMFVRQHHSKRYQMTRQRADTVIGQMTIVHKYMPRSGGDMLITDNYTVITLWHPQA